jgi:hypothetical protein
MVGNASKNEKATLRGLFLVDPGLDMLSGGAQNLDCEVAASP